MVEDISLTRIQSPERILIVANGTVLPQLLTNILQADDVIFGVDGGTDLVLAASVYPNIVLGDMDSITTKALTLCKNKGIPMVTYPCEKDETDFQLAVGKAIQCKPKEIAAIGIFGDRPDHTLANIQVLTKPAKAGIVTKAYFGQGVLHVVTAEIIIEGTPGDTVSLLPLTEKVLDINIRGFKYPLENGRMELGVPFGISNILQKKQGVISIASGILLVCHIRATS